MKRLGLSVLLIFAFVGSAIAQAGGHTLFGDVRVDETQAERLKPLSLHVLLYSESGNLLFRQTVASNGRLRQLPIQNRFSSGHRTRLARGLRAWTIRSAFSRGHV